MTYLPYSTFKIGIALKDLYYNLASFLEQQDQ
jgi:hypothetical protein